MCPMGSDQLADTLREMSPAVAVEVTEAFLDRHPEWRRRYGGRATSAGIEDAGYHLAFLAGAVEGGELGAFAAYSRWAARVLAARGIAPQFLAETMEQLRHSVSARVKPEDASSLAPYFSAAVDALADTPELEAGAALDLGAGVFLQAILTGQRRAALTIAREALANGLSLEQLYVDVFQPALYEVGARWEANRLTVAQEHVATAITQYVMAHVYTPPEDTSATRGTVVLTGVEGELHNIGAVMVGDLLELSGWRVRFLGTNLPTASILAMIREAAPSHVGISATMLFNVGAVRRLIHAIRSEFSDGVTILVGGAAFRTAPDLWRQVAADAFASDLRGVQSLLAGDP